MHRNSPLKSPPTWIQLTASIQCLFAFLSARISSSFANRAKNMADNENSLLALSLHNRMIGCKINETGAACNPSSKIIIHLGQITICKVSLPYLCHYLPRLWKIKSTWVSTWKPIEAFQTLCVQSSSDRGVLHCQGQSSKWVFSPSLFKISLFTLKTFKKNPYNFHWVMYFPFHLYLFSLSSQLGIESHTQQLMSWKGKIIF